MPSKADKPPKPKPFRPYWDACVFISAIQRDPDRIAVLDDLLLLTRPPKPRANEDPEPAKGGRPMPPAPRMLVVTSSIIAAEVIKAKDCGIELEEEKIKGQLKDYLENPWVTKRTADDAICEKAGDLRRQFGKLQTPDAIHLATALRYKVDELHSYDPDLLKLNGQAKFDAEPGKEPGSLIICHPRHPVRLPLFKDTDDA